MNRVRRLWESSRLMYGVEHGGCTLEVSQGLSSIPRRYGLMRLYVLRWIVFLASFLLLGCQGIDLLSPGPVDRGLCQRARAGGEDVAQCLEAQQRMRR